MFSGQPCSFKLKPPPRFQGGRYVQYSFYSPLDGACARNKNTLTVTVDVQ